MAMGERMARVTWPEDVVYERSALIPVPLGNARARTRLQSGQLLALAVSRVWRIPVWHDVLVRQRETATQTRLTPSERASNVSGAFGARSSGCVGFAEPTGARGRRDHDRRHAQCRRVGSQRTRCTPHQLSHIRSSARCGRPAAPTFRTRIDTNGSFASVSTASAASAVRCCAPPSSRASPTSTSLPSTTSRTPRRSRTSSSTTRCTASSTARCRPMPTHHHRW
jgi:hypothetical protein